MTRPPPLKKGDKIGIVATGKKISVDEINSAERILKSWGLGVEIGTHIFSENHKYLAGSDEERSQDFQSMLDNKEIKAIICARGGYGTTRILDNFDFTVFKNYPKWIVGFSDITALHLKLMRMGFETIHGIMPVLFSNPNYAESLASLKQILFGIDFSIYADNNPSNRIGKASGLVVGGNLSLLVDSFGTSAELDLNGKILILEEVDEYFYKIDRMLTQLKRAGKLDNLSGLIIGHMTELKDTSPGFGQTLEEIVLNKVDEYSYPVAFGFPIGHEIPNLAWRHGSRMNLTVSNTGSELYRSTY